MCSVQIFKFLAKIYIINLIFSQEYIFIAFSQESAFSFSQVSNTHLAKIYTTRIRVPIQIPTTIQSSPGIGMFHAPKKRTAKLFCFLVLLIPGKIPNKFTIVSEISAM